MRTGPVLVGLLLMSSCGDATTGSRPAPPEGEPLPVEEQVLTVGALADSYDSAAGRPDLGKFTLNTGVFDGLVRLDESLQVEPVLAERWDFDPVTNTYRFHLREGVKFHDGQDFGAEDVKYTFDLVAASENSAGVVPDGIKVIDSLTVDITPTKENNRLVEDIAHPTWSINRRGSDPLKPLGTGPFRFVEYVEDDRFVVERFDDYWDAARRAKASRITFRFIPDAQTKLLGLRSGELDLIMDVTRDLADQVEGSPGTQVVRSEVGAYNALNFTVTGVAPYDLGQDPAIRKAVSSAIDRQAILDKVWANNAEQSTTWVPPSVLGPAGAMVEGPLYAPDQSREALDRAGWQLGSDGIRVKDGRRLTLTHVVAGPGDSDPRDSVAAAEVIQEQLRDVGVETKIEVPEAAAGLARANNGEYDILHYIANQNSANPCLLPDLFFYSKGSPRARFSGPGGETDVALEACRAATTIEEVRTAAAEAIHQLVDVEHVVVPLMGLYRIWGLKETVAGFVPHPSLTNQRWEGLHLVSGR